MKRNAFGQLMLPPNVRTVVEGVDGGGNDGGDGGNGGSEFKPPASQEELDRIIAQRVSRAERNAREDERRKLTPKPEDDKPKDEKPKDAPAGVSETDVDKRIQEALAAQAKELAVERVSDRIDKALEGRSFSASKLFNLDRSKFVKEDGKTVDAEAIKEWVEKNSTEVAAPNRRLRAQGERDSNVTGGSVQSGRDLYDSTHKKKSGKD
jgi:hypothetical protein